MVVGVILGHHAMGTLYLWNLEVWFGVPNVWEFHPLRMNLYMGVIMGGMIVAFVITSRMLVCHGIIYRLHIVAALSSGAILFFSPHRTAMGTVTNSGLGGCQSQICYSANKTPTVNL